MPTGLQVNGRSPRACRRCASPEGHVLLAPGKECKSEAWQQPRGNAVEERPQTLVAAVALSASMRNRRDWCKRRWLWPCGGGVGVRDHGVPGAGGGGPVACGVEGGRRP